jgi:hypothetical protein
LHTCVYPSTGTIQLVHDITKNELDAAVPSCGRFGPNTAWYCRNLLTYNVLSSLKSLALPPALSAAADALAGLITARARLALVAKALPAG